MTNGPRIPRRKLLALAVALLFSPQPPAAEASSIGRRNFNIRTAAFGSPPRPPGSGTSESASAKSAKGSSSKAPPADGRRRPARAAVRPRPLRSAPPAQAAEARAAEGLRASPSKKADRRGSGGALSGGGGGGILHSVAAAASIGGVVDVSSMPDIEMDMERDPAAEADGALRPKRARMERYSNVTVTSMSALEFVEGKVVGLKKTNGESAELNGKKDRRAFLPRILFRRHERSIEKGMRREKAEEGVRQRKMESLLKGIGLGGNSKKDGGKRYGARTITGLISALAQESSGLSVEVDARSDTPLWNKQVDNITINFSRLGFQPLRMGGLDAAMKEFENSVPPGEKDKVAERLHEAVWTRNHTVGTTAADDAFNRIDADSSGALDVEEIVAALDEAARSNIAADRSSGGVGGGNGSGTGTSAPREVLEGLAARLVRLYDINGDGVVDREEYRKMVGDMAALRRSQLKKMELEKEQVIRRGERWGWLPWRSSGDGTAVDDPAVIHLASDSSTDNVITSTADNSTKGGIDFASAVDVSSSSSHILSHGEGSIVLSDMKLDLRRLLFGAVPLVKKITPGGPLILEPFTMTVTASLNREDLLSSPLLDRGLRMLVARALRRRVRSLRDLLDGAVFYGRTWNMASKHAPVVEVPRISDIEFDNDRLIITGAAQVRTTPGSPLVESTFKLRTRLGTRRHGRVIRLKDPQIALVAQCPRAWERNIVQACKRFKLPVPKRPEPIYTYIPLVNPIKQTDQDGYFMGEDNQLKSIEIKNGALRLEMSAILRPGRFLGNHYLAFTVPQRTLIVTMDRVKNAIRSARKNKKLNERTLREKVQSERKKVRDTYQQAVATALSSEDVETKKESFVANTAKAELAVKDSDLRFVEPKDRNEKITPNYGGDAGNGDEKKKGFVGRFVEGYIGSTAEDFNQKRNERLFDAISEWFGRQDEGDQIMALTKNGEGPEVKLDAALRDKTT